MDNKDKKLAIKIFDHFFKKAGVICIKVFEGVYTQLKFPDKMTFSLDVCVYIRNSGFYDVRAVRINAINRDFMTFYAPASYADLVRTCHFKTFKLTDMPNVLKEAVVNSCIMQNIACVIYNNGYHDNITLIPKASSLEELAIKMELER